MRKIRTTKYIFVLAVCAVAFVMVAGRVSFAETAGFNHTGLTLPRFASLVSDEVNVRTGPGLKYPIRWVFVREDMPIEIIREFDAWREIRDMNGDGGWVHKSLLSGRRTGLIKDKMQTVFRDQDTESRPVVQLEPDVVVSLEECDQTWCHIDVAGYSGWMEKGGLWGIYKHEELED